jgi:hypothetical protein
VTTRLALWWHVGPAETAWAVAPVRGGGLATVWAERRDSIGMTYLNFWVVEFE